MTTKAMADRYLAEHLARVGGRKWAVFNPNNLPEYELPVIYGFNNGGGGGLLSAALVSEDGEWLGGHACSHEGYMENDLGILEGTRADRHETFQKHYPEGYRMEFVRYSEFKDHKKLQEACQLAEAKSEEKEV